MEKRPEVLILDDVVRPVSPALFRKMDDLFIVSLPDGDGDKQVPLALVKHHNMIAKNQTNVPLVRAGISLVPNKDRDRNKYEPHHGSREALRRLKQMQKQQLIRLSADSTTELPSSSSSPKAVVA